MSDPRAIPSQSVSQPATEAGDVARLDRKTILVVDDEESTLKVLRRFLSLRYRVFCAHNTVEADAVLQANTVHVVVCDQTMPGENGLQFFSRLRRSHPLIPRILLTGYSEPDTLLTAINKTAVHRYLVKPISFDDLCQAVDDALIAHDSETRREGLGKENAELRTNLQSVLERSPSLQETPGKLLAVSFGWVIAVLVAALLLGLLVFVILYALKPALGIDFLPNWSHSDRL